MDKKSNSLSARIENAVEDYLSNPVYVMPGVTDNTHKKLQLWNLFWLGIYETGNVDSQGRYKYWYDIITSRVEDEVKASDINTNNIIPFSFANVDTVPMFILQSGLRDEFKSTHEGVELNDAKEEFSAFGNILWKKVKDGYERKDLLNTYVLNQTAKYIVDHKDKKKVYSDVVERYEYNQIDLREKKGIWFDDKVKELISAGGKTERKTEEENEPQQTETPFWEIYEFNGLVNLKELKEIRKEAGMKTDIKVFEGDEDEYVIAKIVKPVDSTDDSDILYAKEIKEMPYSEAHRGIYKGLWLRDGIIAILLDRQNRANELGNQIAKGLEFAGQVIFTSDERTIAENILTDLQRGDIIKAKNLHQVDVRLRNLDQLIAEWNLNIQEADRLCKTFDITRGETMPAGTPYRLGSLLDSRASEFHNYIRQKFALGYKKVIREWICPSVINKLKAKDVITLTGSLEYMNQYYELAVKGWMLRNVEVFGPMTKETREAIKQEKVEQLKSMKENKVILSKDMWKGVLRRMDIVIVGESVDLWKELQNHATFINLEADPVRRTALIERAMALSGIDISQLPKTEQPQITNPVQPMEGINFEDILNNAQKVKAEGQKQPIQVNK